MFAESAKAIVAGLRGKELSWGGKEDFIRPDRHFKGTLQSDLVNLTSGSLDQGGIMSTTFLAEKSPADEFSLQNRAVVRDKSSMYAKVLVAGLVQECYLTLGSHPRMDPGKIGLSGPQVATIDLTIC